MIVWNVYYTPVYTFIAWEYLKMYKKETATTLKRLAVKLKNIFIILLPVAVV